MDSVQQSYIGIVSSYHAFSEISTQSAFIRVHFPYPAPAHFHAAKCCRCVTFIPSLIQHRERQKMLAFAGINQKNIKQEAASSHTGNGFYLSSFISSSMALSIAGRYFSGQSCTLYFTRWYCSVSCFRSSGLKYFSAGNLHR